MAPSAPRFTTHHSVRAPGRPRMCRACASAPFRPVTASASSCSATNHEASGASDSGKGREGEAHMAGETYMQDAQRELHSFAGGSTVPRASTLSLAHLSSAPRRPHPASPPAPRCAPPRQTSRTGDLQARRQVLEESGRTRVHREGVGAGQGCSRAPPPALGKLPHQPHGAAHPTAHPRTGIEKHCRACRRCCPRRSQHRLCWQLVKHKPCRGEGAHRQALVRAGAAQQAQTINPADSGGVHPRWHTGTQASHH